MKEYKIRLTTEGIWFKFPIGILFSVLIVYFLIGDFNWILIMVLFFFCRLSFYSFIDYLFTKTFIETTDKALYLKVFFMDILLNKERCFTIIQGVFIPNNIDAKFYVLKIVRNEKQWWKRLFKNKIKLYPEDKKIDLVGVAKKIEEMFGIPYRGIDLFWQGQGYSDDTSVLMKNKGIVP